MTAVRPLVGGTKTEIPAGDERASASRENVNQAATRTLAPRPSSTAVLGHGLPWGAVD